MRPIIISNTFKIVFVLQKLLITFSQRWKKEQHKMEAMSAASGHTFR